MDGTSLPLDEEIYFLKTVKKTITNNLMNIQLKKLIFLFLFNIILFGCSMSTEELEQEISRSISEQIAENSSVNSVFDEFIGNIEFVDFQLIHKEVMNM